MNKKVLSNVIIVINVLCVLIIGFICVHAMLNKKDKAQNITTTTVLSTTTSDIIDITTTTTSEVTSTTLDTTSTMLTSSTVSTSFSTTSKQTTTNNFITTTTKDSIMNYMYGDFMFNTSKSYYTGDDRSVLVYVRRIDGADFNYSTGHHLYYKNNDVWELVPHVGGYYTYKKVMMIASRDTSLGYARGHITVNFSSFDFDFPAGEYRIDFVGDANQNPWGQVYFKIK